MSRLLSFDGKGIYCARANVHIDPWKKVKKALVTHAHSDHARRGMSSYLATHATVPLLKHRLGKNIIAQGVNYGEELSINGVKFSFHPAGHVVGSAQIRVEYQGEVWVVSGDYKLVDDGISKAFEPVKCHTFITESTFGLPIYNWRSQDDIFRDINNWWRENKEAGMVSVLTAYSLGKAQRLIQNIDHSIGSVYTHLAIESTNRVIRESGIDLKATQPIEDDRPKQDYIGAMIIAPGSAANSIWADRFGDVRIGSASGWMNLRSARKWRATDKSFTLSDHADWRGLNAAIKETEASELYVTHGYSEIFSKFLREQGYDAKVVKTAFEGERRDVEEEKVA